MVNIGVSLDGTPQSQGAILKNLTIAQKLLICISLSMLLIVGGGHSRPVPPF